MIETFPLKRAIPMIFKGSGDCTKIDWTFLGGSIANWSFVCFVAFALVLLVLVWSDARGAPDTSMRSAADEFRDQRSDCGQRGVALRQRAPSSA